MIFAPQIMRFYLGGVENLADRQAELELGTFFLRWFLPQIVFYGIGAVAAGMLTANRRFAAPMFAPVLNNIVVIATMVVFIALRHGRRPDDRERHHRSDSSSRRAPPSASSR